MKVFRFIRRVYFTIETKPILKIFLKFTWWIIGFAFTIWFISEAANLIFYAGEHHLDDKQIKNFNKNAMNRIICSASFLTIYWTLKLCNFGDSLFEISNRLNLPSKIEQEILIYKTKYTIQKIQGYIDKNNSRLQLRIQQGLTNNRFLLTHLKNYQKELTYFNDELLRLEKALEQENSNKETTKNGN